MALALAEFLNKYPEFVSTDTDQVNAALAEAELLVGDTWGVDRRDSIVGLEAAHILAISPQGRAAKLSASDGSSTYQARLDKLKRAIACAHNVRIQ